LLDFFLNLEQGAPSGDQVEEKGQPFQPFVHECLSQ